MRRGPGQPLGMGQRRRKMADVGNAADCKIRHRVALSNNWAYSDRSDLEKNRYMSEMRHELRLW